VKAGRKLRRIPAIAILLKISSKTIYAVFCLSSLLRRRRQPRTSAAQAAGATQRPALQEISQFLLHLLPAHSAHPGHDTATVPGLARLERKHAAVVYYRCPAC
jgi:hypothetical protein